MNTPNTLPSHINCPIHFWSALTTCCLILLLAACGTSGSTSSTPGTGNTPVPTATSASSTNTTSTGPSCSVASASPAIYASNLTAGPTNPPTVGTAPASSSDGLQCIDLKVGSGSVAQSGSTVSVQYTGWLASNGQKFDSSYDHGGQPFQVTLGQGQVIQGWDVGLIGMKPGGIRRLIIPGSLAYGAQGSPPTIPANATLIFDVIMVS